MFYQGFRLKDIYSGKLLRLYVNDVQIITVKNCTGQLVHTTNVRIPFATTLTDENQQRQKNNRKVQEFNGGLGGGSQTRNSHLMLKVEKEKKKSQYISLGISEAEKGEGKEGAKKSTYSSQSPHENPYVSAFKTIQSGLDWDSPGQIS